MTVATTACLATHDLFHKHYPERRQPTQSPAETGTATSDDGDEGSAKRVASGGVGEPAAKVGKAEQ